MLLSLLSLHNRHYLPNNMDNTESAKLALEYSPPAMSHSDTFSEYSCPSDEVSDQRRRGYGRLNAPIHAMKTCNIARIPFL